MRDTFWTYFKTMICENLYPNLYPLNIKHAKADYQNQNEKSTDTMVLCKIKEKTEVAKTMTN